MGRNLFILAVMLAFAACGGGRKNTAAMQNNEEKETPLTLVGAFGNQREITEQEMEMFRAVTQEQDSVVYTPLSVSTQVVAGINYRFWCRFENTLGQEDYGHCWVTVFKPLPGQGNPRVTRVDRDTLR